MGDFITTAKLNEVLSELPEENRVEAVDLLIAEGHEIEGLNTEFSPFESVGNAPMSLIEFGKNMARAVVSPIETFNSLSTIARGAVRTGIEALQGEELPEFVPRIGAESDEAAFDGMVNFFAERYGGRERFLETIERDPVGFLSDVATVLGGTGAITRGVGTAGKLSTVEKTGEMITKLSQALEPTTFLSKGINTITKPVRNQIRRFNEATGVNTFLRNVSNQLAKNVVEITKSKNTQIASKVGVQGQAVNFLTKHGIHGSLEMIELQLNHIKNASFTKVDDLLKKTKGTHKPRDAGVLLNEIRRQMVDEFDVLESGSIAVPKDRLSTESLAVLNEINGLSAKFSDVGLTLSELNRVKRLSDEFLSLFKESGGAKSSFRLKDLSKAREQVKGFIEKEAAKSGVKNIKELNQQTSIAKGIGDEVRRRIDAGRNRTPWVDRATSVILGGGVGAGVASGSPVIGGLAAVGGLGLVEIMRLPSVKSYFSTRIRLLADGEFAELQGAIQTGRQTSKSRKIIQRELKRFRQAFPELRLAGIAQGQSLERGQVINTQPPSFTTIQDATLTR